MEDENGNSIPEEQSVGLFSLPEDLVGKIIARFSYPDIIQARCLSKRWRHLLSGNSAQPDVKAFLDEVRSVSSTWPSFSPVVKCGECLLAYDPISQIWRNITWSALPSEECLEFKVIDDGAESLVPLEVSGQGSEHERRYDQVMQSTHCAGSLVCYFERPCLRRRSLPTTLEEEGFRITVANLVTGKSKVLCPPVLAEKGRWLWVEDRFFHVLTDGFIIVQLYSNRNVPHLDLAIHVFDSREARWCDAYFEKSESVFDGELYESSRIRCYSELVEDSRVHFFATDCTSPILGQFDCSSKAWSCHELSDTIAFRSQGHFCFDHFFLCGSRVLIVHGIPWGPLSRLIVVLECIQASNTVVTLENGFVVRMKQNDYVHVSSDQEHIYVGVSAKQGKDLSVHSYNVRYGGWRQLPRCTVNSPQRGSGFDETCHWVHGSYSPGFNPFHNPAPD